MNNINYSSRKLFIPLIIFIGCFVLYGNTIRNDYVFDDFIYTVNNEYVVKGFSSIKDIFDKGSLYGVKGSIKDNASQYRPLALLNFMAEVSIFGLNPHVSHFFNVLFFAFSVVLLYFFLQKILKNYNQAVIIAATLLFALHPIHTEVVDSIKNRDEILGLLFGLASFYFIMLYAEKTSKELVPDATDKPRKNTGYYFLSIIGFLLAIFCKEDCVSYVLIIPLLLYFFTSFGIKKIIVKTIPYAVSVAFYLFIRSRVLDSMTFTNQIPVWSNTLMAATNNADRIATGFLLMGKYLYMTFIPYPLSWDYSYNQIPVVSWGNSKPILSLAVVIILIGYMIYGFRKKSIFSFLIALFFVTILLSSNLIVQIAWTFGERFLYTPSLAFCIALPVFISNRLKLNSIPPVKENKTTVFYGIIAGLLVVYAIILFPRNNVWKNNFTLYESGIETAPHSYRPYRSLGLLYMLTDTIKSKPEYQFAEKELKKSLEICMRSDAFYYLGVCFEKEGYPDSAISIYKRILELNNEYFVNAANNLGTIYLNKTQYDSGIFYFMTAFKKDSNNLEPLKKIVYCCQNEKNFPLAFHYDSIILEKAPDKKPILNHFAFLHNEFGIQCGINNDLDKALKEFQIALSFDSNFVNAIGNMGLVYEKKGNIELAKYNFQKALSKDPNNEVFANDLQMLNRSSK